MANQQQIHGTGGGSDEQDEAFEAGQAQINTAGTDDLLDEIDALLDTNAEEFVRSFVQKGGQ
ncbi:ubiquitin-like protein Pup [Corynebacterium aquatimens]|uniref:ubiquitin-like protein Pup n=1 Tax=Corynebacterium TaxID=1716 RepID=UPI001F269881|nr:MULTISPECIES: ubiquitin-like protein Pup [Corynebacterium]QYH19742.1 ubiquitin-like protein Pup [Corynebacterium aquatimens]UIZ93146.1 ubiquitin-like protein Pup [Corynebacterium sp. CNCTC7651]